jgi:Protein of unknown function (DUF992)
MQLSFTIIAGAAAIAIMSAVSGAQAQSRVEAGVLSCTSVGANGFVVQSTRLIRCRFNRKGRDELYSISLKWKVGTDNFTPGPGDGAVHNGFIARTLGGICCSHHGGRLASAAPQVDKPQPWGAMGGAGRPRTEGKTAIR